MPVPRMPNSLIRIEAFLREADNRARKRSAIDINFGVAIFCYFGLVFALLKVLTGEHSTLGSALILLIPLFVSRRIYRYLERNRSDRVSLKDPLHATYVELIDELKSYSANRSLGERLHPAVARQLEGSAEVFFRVRTWLKAPTSKRVLGDAIHKDVLLATDRAMREIIFTVHGTYRPSGMQRKKWEKIVEADPDALETCEALSRISGLLDQLSEIVTKVGSFGVTITLTDQLRAVSDAIEELEQTSFAHLKCLPAPTAEDQVSVPG